ncbi:hypothetical protein D3C77_508950 [compost metagenome]
MNAVIRLIAIAACIFLVVQGHSSTSYGRLSLMFVGLAGLLGLLYEYNRKYQ